MSSDLTFYIVVPAVLVGISVVVVGASSVLIRRYIAIKQFGEIPKPEVVTRLTNRMSLEEIKELLHPDLVAIEGGRYLWQREVAGRGRWTVVVEVADPFLGWTVSFESTESTYLSYSYGCLKP